MKKRKDGGSSTGGVPAMRGSRWGGVEVRKGWAKIVAESGKKDFKEVSRYLHASVSGETQSRPQQNLCIVVRVRSFVRWAGTTSWEDDSILHTEHLLGGEGEPDDFRTQLAEGRT